MSSNTKRIICFALVFVLMHAIVSVDVIAKVAAVTIKEIVSGLDYDSAGSYANFSWTEFGSAGGFSDGLLAVGKEGKWGFIDKNGKVIVPLQYDGVYTFSEGLALVVKDTKYGYVDKTGNEVITPTYANAWSFSEGLAGVRTGSYSLSGRTGFIDKTGKVVIPLEYDMVSKFSEGFAVVMRQKLVQRPDDWPERYGDEIPSTSYGYVDRTGRLIRPMETSVAYDFSEGFGQVEEGFIDYTGKVVIQIAPTLSIHDFSEELALVKGVRLTDGSLPLVDDMNVGFAGEERILRPEEMFIDREGNIVFSGEDEIVSFHSFSEGMAAAGKRPNMYTPRKWGFIDKGGNVVIQCEYDDVEDFKEGFARVSNDGKYGYINKTGKLVVPIIYERPAIGSVNDQIFLDGTDFSEGFARVYKDGKWGFVDTTGEVIVPLIYDEVYPFNGGLSAGFKDGKLSIFEIVEKPISVIVNGSALALEQPPIIENERTLVPLRAIFEALGADVEWDQSTQTVTAIRGDVIITLRIDSNILTRNNDEIKLDVSAHIIGGRTVVPVRAIAESFGAEVDWNPETRTVKITE